MVARWQALIHQETPPVWGLSYIYKYISKWFNNERWHHFQWHSIDFIRSWGTVLSDFNIPTISSVVTWVKNILFTNAGPIKWRWDPFWPGIFLAKLGPILVKNSLNLLLISVPSETIVPSLNLNLSCIFLFLFLFTIFFIICRVFFILSLWEFNRSVKCCFSAHFKMIFNLFRYLWYVF